jgi:membrane protein YqaA with SNARE-associated domain
LSSFLAATIIPFSSEAHFYYLISENYNLWLLLIAASTGNTIGGMTSYVLGYYCKWSWLEKYFRIKRKKAQRYELKITQYGFWMAALCWLPIVGDVLAVALGLFRVKWWKVLIVMFISKGFRYYVLTFI